MKLKEYHALLSRTISIAEYEVQKVEVGGTIELDPTRAIQEQTDELTEKLKDDLDVLVDYYAPRYHHSRRRRDDD